MMRFSVILPLAAVGASHGLPGQAKPCPICSDPFAPIDPQRIRSTGDMTAGDYMPPPGHPWNDATKTGSRSTHKIALVAVDYDDQPFVITEPTGSTVFGNPQPVTAGFNVSRDSVPAFYRDLLNVPGELNRGRTLHEYWMEDSGGEVGVELVEFGPYRMPHLSYQYGIDYDVNPGACPSGSTCGLPLYRDAEQAWRGNASEAVASSFKYVFVLSAGQCEQTTWRAFGADKFATEQDIPDAFGPPRGGSGEGSRPGNAAMSLRTWTSWASASRVWPATVTYRTTINCEDSALGTYVHEMSHLLHLADNYPSPRESVRRGSNAGSWSPMNRGAFNGPGRASWHVPSLQAGSVPSSHTVNEKNQLWGFSRERLPYFDAEDLARGGLVVARVTARTANAGAVGLRIRLRDDPSPPCDQRGDVLCDEGGFRGYDVEVVDRMGADSFQPDAGVLISKYRDGADVGACRQWVVDAAAQGAGPAAEAPDDTALKLPRALFHAGERSGSTFEYVDEPNGLHLYVVDRHRQPDGVLSYTVAARSTRGSGRSVHGVALGRGTPGSGLLCTFDLGNNGTYVRGAGLSAWKKHFETDVYRLDATVQGAGWRVALPNALAAARFGETVQVRVAVGASPDAADVGVVTLRARSESRPEAEGTAECRITRQMG